MTTHSSRPARSVPPPQGSARPGPTYSRFIPREELGAFAAWNPGTLNTELTAIAGLEQRHAAATDRLARLDELHLAEWRNQLGLHVALVSGL